MPRQLSDHKDEIGCHRAIKVNVLQKCHRVTSRRSSKEASKTLPAVFGTGKNSKGGPRRGAKRGGGLVRGKRTMRQGSRWFGKIAGSGHPGKSTGQGNKGNCKQRGETGKGTTQQKQENVLGELKSKPREKRKETRRGGRGGKKRVGKLRGVPGQKKGEGDVAKIGEPETIGGRGPGRLRGPQTTKFLGPGNRGERTRRFA